MVCGFVSFFFFFQAEDGIRDGRVTGVQTCALPISVRRQLAGLVLVGAAAFWFLVRPRLLPPDWGWRLAADPMPVEMDTAARSEERRVGKEGRSRGSPDHLKKKKGAQRRGQERTRRQ